MLEEVIFNMSLYRYREESNEYGIVYNLRYGDIYWLTGNTKKLIEAIYKHDGVIVDVDNKVINYFIHNKVILICERKENEFK